MRIAIITVLGTMSISLSACTTVPVHDGMAAVHVSDVVARIKCDLVKVVLNKAVQRSRYVPGSPFLFLQGWAAKVHFQIIVDKMASVSPGATIIDPLKSVGGVAQTFNLGVGIGNTTQAVRTEEYDFLLSFSDLNSEFQNGAIVGPLYNGCEPANGLLLESDLDMKSMVDSALEPVERGILKPGRDVGPGPAPPATPRITFKAQRDLAASILASIRNASARPERPDLSKSIKEMVEIGSLQTKSIMNIPGLSDRDFKVGGQATDENADRPALVNETKAVLADGVAAATAESRMQALINNVVKPLYGIATQTVDPECLVGVTKNEFSAIANSADLSLATVSIYEERDPAKSATLLERVRADERKTISATGVMLSSIDACSKAVRRTPPLRSTTRSTA